MIRNTLLENKSPVKSKVLDDYVLNLLDKTFVIPKSFKYQIIEISDEFVCRMDLISKLAYNTDSYSDILCKLNGISNPFELNEGDKIIIPDFSDITKFFYIEDVTEKEDDTNESVKKPVAKDVKEKRKPNEAVVGDKRYRIDKNKRVVIY